MSHVGFNSSESRRTKSSSEEQKALLTRLDSEFPCGQGDLECFFFHLHKLSALESTDTIFSKERKKEMASLSMGCSRLVLSEGMGQSKDFMLSGDSGRKNVDNRRRTAGQRQWFHVRVSVLGLKWGSEFNVHIGEVENSAQDPRPVVFANKLP